MKTIRVSELKKNPTNLVNLLKEEDIKITDENNEEIAVLLSIDKFESMKAMIELSGDIKKLQKLYDDNKKIQNGDMSDCHDLPEGFIKKTPKTKKKSQLLIARKRRRKIFELLYKAERDFGKDHKTASEFAERMLFEMEKIDILFSDPVS